MKIRLDSPLITVGTKITNLIILNLFWLIGCIPIVTIGTSTIAAFTVTLKMTEDREHFRMTKQFWSAYCKNLKHGIPLTIIILAGIYASWLNLQMFQNLDNNPIVFLIFGILIIALLVVHFLYAFALEARYENKMLYALVNSRKICIRYFPRTLSLIGILILQVMLFQVGTVMMYIGIFCLPVLMIYTVSQVVMPLFRKIEHEKEE